MLTPSLTPPCVNLVSYLSDSGQHIQDPSHAHSFQRITFSTITAVQRSRLFFRNCLVCEERMLVVGQALSMTPREQRLRTTRRRISSMNRIRKILEKDQNNGINVPASPIKQIVDPIVAHNGIKSSTRCSTPRHYDTDTLCQCLNCGQYIHRMCLTEAHRYRVSSYPIALVPTCVQPPRHITKPNKAPITTVQSIDSSNIHRGFVTKRRLSSTVTISALIDKLTQDDANSHHNVSTNRTVSTTAATVVRRMAPFLAAGGIVGAIALGPGGGLVAGLNLLLSSATVEGMVAGLGLTATVATATATHHRKNKQHKQEDIESGSWAMLIWYNCKKAYVDQGPSDAACRMDATLVQRFQSQDKPTVEELYTLLFSIISTSTELLSHINSSLYHAFIDRQQKRMHMSNQTQMVRDTLQDAKMFVVHLTGATLQSFPSLSTTETALVTTSMALERIVFSDIYPFVLSPIEVLLNAETTILCANAENLRRYPSPLQIPTTDLVRIETLLTEMIKTVSPLMKLELLSSSFRHICCVADALHETASNADILIPMVGTVLISCSNPEILQQILYQLAFISFFTEGGGKGVQGYVLTTFQAALEVLMSVNEQGDSYGSNDMQIGKERLSEDDFYDAVGYIPESNCLMQG